MSQHLYNFGRTGLAIDVGITDPVTKFSSSKSGFDSICKGFYANQSYDGKIKHFDECMWIVVWIWRHWIFSNYFWKFGFIDPRSRKVLDDIIKMASENMSKDISKIKSHIHTKVGVSLARTDEQAGVARYCSILDTNTMINNCKLLYMNILFDIKSLMLN